MISMSAGQRRECQKEPHVKNIRARAVSCIIRWLVIRKLNFFGGNDNEDRVGDRGAVDSDSDLFD